MKRPSPILFAVLALLCASCAVEWTSPEERPEVRVVFLDVGQGDAALLSAGNRHWLVDAGSAGRGLPARLAQRGVDSLAGIFLTHRHEDHFGGAAEVLRAIPVGKVHLSGDPSRSDLWNAFEKTLRESGVPADTLWRGDWIEFCASGLDCVPGEWGLRVLWPHHGLLHEGNNASLVMQLATPAARALFMGDAEREVEEELVSIEGARLESEVLKVGHHGSKTSSALPFLAEVRPMRAVVSVGSRNNHGHPDAAVLADLALVLDGAARVLRTDELSDVEIVFGPAGFYEKDLGEETAEAWARW